MICVSKKNVLVPLMDGAIALRTIVGYSTGLEILKSFDTRDHGKPVVSAQFNFSGNKFATASYDKSVIIYRISSSGDIVKTAVVQLPCSPECLVFVPGSVAQITTSDDQAIDCGERGGVVVENMESDEYDPEEEDLVIGIRDVPYLLYLNCKSYTTKKVINYNLR